MNKSLWIDNTKAIALIGVILVHVAGVATAIEFNTDGSSNTTWWIANIYDSLFRFCVPLFVMVTGTLLLPQKQIPLGDFLKKRLNRILLPFIFWTIIYIAFNVALMQRKESLTEFSTGWVFTQIVSGAWPHLWYVYMIIGLYLFVPIIKPWVQTASNKVILYFLAIWFVTIVINQQKIITLTSHLDLSYFGGYLGYLILGYYISERMVITSLSRKLAVLLIILGYGITVAGTFFLTEANGEFSHAFYEYLTVNVLCMSVGLFILLRSADFEFNEGLFATFRNIFSRYGFGIYLAHGLILSILFHLKIDYDWINPWIAIPVSSLICLLATTLLVYIIDRLPYGKYISG